MSKTVKTIIVIATMLMTFLVCFIVLTKCNKDNDSNSSVVQTEPLVEYLVGTTTVTETTTSEETTTTTEETSETTNTEFDSGSAGTETTTVMAATTSEIATTDTTRTTLAAISGDVVITTTTTTTTKTTSKTAVKKENTINNTTFLRSLTATYYIPRADQKAAGLKGGSGRELIDCYTGNEFVKGSVACKYVYDRYGYNYCGRTMVYLECDKYPDIGGYYYLDDCCGSNCIVDLYFSKSSNCPYKNAGVIKDVKLYVIKY